MLSPVERGSNGLVVAGGVLVGLAVFALWTLITVAVVYGANSAFGDTGGVVAGFAILLVPLAAAVLLLVLPGTRAAGSGFVGGLAGGFLIGVLGALLLFWAAGFSL